ncbi:hypothetical protein EDB84DRAFT_1499748 [Lactarius hengduanensis]|nr:hypothetical protein EDB84DRAFT_1499748 [Lactarius hengduanensis]
MTLTRSAARALLKSQVTVDKLPEEVLLEIFGACRQDMELQPDYENVWNGENGWLILAHVSRSWRRVVLSSPSSLHMHLLFTPGTSSRANMLSHLPPFPIWIDYRAASWTEREENLALTAISHRSRVRRIALQRPYKDMAKLLTALSHPFPKLEGLEICPTHGCFGQELILPTAFLAGSAPRLRQLTLRGVVPRCLSPLLSSATGLVELVLTLKVAFGALPEASFIASLQHMSCLRRLDLDLDYTMHFESGPPPPANPGYVPLPKLTHLTVRGHRLYWVAFVVWLSTPSLQHFDCSAVFD